ncbi:DUF5317 family protein [Phytohabitans sp. LJ34]|uniref:DUF5317 family protein n=1 Tax=Phytohabitans sp. LJ34 TaxID=3452217 RepID=UPI003F8BF629
MWALMLLPIVISLIVLAIRRGGLRALQSIRLRGLSLIWGAAAVQFVRISDPAWASAVLRPGDGVLPVVLIWLLGIAFVAVNLRSPSENVRPGLGIFALGFTLNTATIALNGGMPLSAWAARKAGFSERAIAASNEISAETMFPIFADVIPVPALRIVLSLGDLLMFAGICWLIIALARRDAPARSTSQPAPSL